MRKTLKATYLLPFVGTLILCGVTSHSMRAAALRAFGDHQEPSRSLLAEEIDLIPALGYESCLADCVWLDFVQFLGANSPAQPNFAANATRYLDEMVRLDPSFTEAYYFAAIVLGGDCHEPDLAAAMIEVGQNENPNDWRLPYIAGLNQFLYAHNNAVAAKYYLKASRLSGAPNWLERQSKILASNIPEIIKQINVWNKLYADASDAPLRQIAKANLCKRWYQVYREAPSELIRRRAIIQLRNLGVEARQSQGR